MYLMEIVSRRLQFELSLLNKRVHRVWKRMKLLLAAIIISKI